MKQITIGNIKAINPVIIEQIKKESPREGLKNDLGNILTQDPWVQFANNQTACILQEEDQLLSFCVIGQDLTFNKVIAEAMNLDAKKSISLLYLFTVQHYQRQQNAQQLGTHIINYIKTQLPHIKYIIGSTGNNYAKQIYSQYGSQEVLVDDSLELQELEINSQSFFKFSL